jgi:hypothetical protein
LHFRLALPIHWIAKHANSVTVAILSPRHLPPRKEAQSSSVAMVKSNTEMGQSAFEVCGPYFDQSLATTNISSDDRMIKPDKQVQSQLPFYLGVVD